MSAQGLTVVGSINEDITVVGRRLPRPGETITADGVRRTLGGKGANQAAAASRLGARVHMIGARGDDEAGMRSVDALRLAGVDTSGVRVVARPTGTALIVVDSAGENQIAVALSANDEVSVDHTISAATAVLCQQEIPLRTVADICRYATGFVALNAAPAHTLPATVVRRCDLIIVNEAEHAALPELSSARMVAVTYGAAGAAMFRGGIEAARCAAPKVTVASTVGAGDAFCAALVLAVLGRQPDDAALRTACAVGAAAAASDDTQPAFEPLNRYAQTNLAVTP
jgi:ribokinase